MKSSLKKETNEIAQIFFCSQNYQADKMFMKSKKNLSMS